MKRGKKYNNALKLIDKNKEYSLDEALELLPQTSTTNFDSTVEVHIKLGIDPKKSDQQVRTTVTLPHGTGKKRRIAVFAEGKAADDAKAAGAEVVGGEDLIEEIKRTGKTDFDIALATPDIMKHLAKIARILGPRGLMPNPKADTVTPDIKKAMEDLSKGKQEIKNDRSGNIHVGIGKVSFPKEQLKENFLALLEAVRQAKPEEAKGTYIKSITLTTTMGPGIKVKV